MDLDLTLEFERLSQFALSKLTTQTVTQISYLCRANIADNLKLNSQILGQVLKGGANIYALWIKRGEAAFWELVYIGQRKDTQIRSRIQQHLFKKHERTGSQLTNVQDALNSGYQIGVTVILVKPDELRTAVEERMITVMKKKGLCTWNIHS